MNYDANIMTIFGLSNKIPIFFIFYLSEYVKAIDRLYQYLDSIRVKPTNFERELGLSNGYLSSQKKRSADMGESIIVKITDYCQDMSLEWFLTGRGEMLRLDDGTPTVAQSKSTIIYRDNPKDAEIIALQREQIGLLKEQITDLKKVSTLGSATSEDYPPAVAEIISNTLNNKS